MIEIDQRIKVLINSSNDSYTRCMFVLIGNNSVENIPILLSVRNYDDEYEPKVLWCFKKENNYIKRSGKNNRKFEKSCKKMSVEDSNYDNFVFSSNINWCHYNDSDNILGMTFDVCVFQDFESLTPNIIAKVIETVKGGGVIFFVLPLISKVSEFGSMEMDVHKKYKTFSYDKVEFRFNYRFFYSLLNNNSCLILDKDLQIIPVNYNEMVNLNDLSSSSAITKKIDKKLVKLKRKEASDHDTVGPIIDMCATKDQTRAFINLIDCFTVNSNLSCIPQNKKRRLNNNFIDHLHKICMITAGRGRGKSVLLGLTIAAAINKGLTNICVTAPCLDNIGTLMQFIVKGLLSLGYKENEDFVTQSQPLSSGKGSCVAEIEVVKNLHRQTVKYIQPTQNNELVDKLDLLCIDETAAIPLPIVRRLLSLRCNFVFMSSTIHGYEGTGRSLSLKLMKQIKESFAAGDNNDRFCEVKLNDPIRYSSKDGIEHWLNNLFCLSCTDIPNNDTNSNNNVKDDEVIHEIINNQPSINDCQLFLVNRDLLFSGHPSSEQLLQRIMAIYVSSHYKNTPNDLQMLSDSSSHALFCLGKAACMSDGLPIVCAVIQVAFEGSIDPLVAKSSMEKGLRPSGDMTPWTVVQQFNQYDFSKLSGARIVRIAVHPQLQRQGYGGQALKLLHGYFDRKNPTKPSVSEHELTLDQLVREDTTCDILSNVTKIPSVSKLGPLLVNLADRSSETLDYLSVSFGLTSELLRFWKKNGFTGVYLRQTVNDTTGEHSCVMMKAMTNTEAVEGSVTWLQTYNNEFSRRFCNLLSGPFRKMDSILALEILQKKSKTISISKQDISRGDINTFFTDSDFQRIDKYLRNLIDYHAIVDLLFGFALLHNTRQIEKVKLPKFQELVLVGMGLQHKTVDELTLDITALQAVGSKATSSSEVLGHLRECLKSLSKTMKNVLK